MHAYVRAWALARAFVSECVCVCVGGGGLGQEGGGKEWREEGRKFDHQVTALPGSVRGGHKRLRKERSERGGGGGGGGEEKAERDGERKRLINSSMKSTNHKGCIQDTTERRQRSVTTDRDTNDCFCHITRTQLPPLHSAAEFQFTLASICSYSGSLLQASSLPQQAPGTERKTIGKLPRFEAPTRIWTSIQFE